MGMYQISGSSYATIFQHLVPVPAPAKSHKLPDIKASYFTYLILRTDDAIMLNENNKTINQKYKHRTNITKKLTN